LTNVFVGVIGPETSGWPGGDARAAFDRRTLTAAGLAACKVQNQRRP